MSVTRMASAAYDTFDKAADAVRALEAAGFGKEEIAIVTNNPYKHDSERLDVEEHTVTRVGEPTNDEDRSMLGGAVGGAAGSILFGLVFPPLAPFVAAGWLGAALGGAVLGGAAGLVSSLVGGGHEERHADGYAAAVEAGATLVSVRCVPERLNEAEAILSVGKSAILPLEEAD